MLIIVSELTEDFSNSFFDIFEGFVGTFMIIVIVIMILIFILACYLISGKRKAMGGPRENVKEGEKSVYFSGYGNAKKNTRKEKQIQTVSSKSTKVCKTCGSFIKKDLEICSICGSTEFQYQDY